MDFRRFFPCTPLSGRPVDSQICADHFIQWHSIVHSLDKTQGRRARAFISNPKGRRFLEILFSHSPYLTRLLFSEMAFFLDLVETGPQKTQNTLTRELAHYEMTNDQARFKKHLRILKRRQALALACGDLTGIQPIEENVKALSNFADTVLSTIVEYLLHDRVRKKELSPLDPAHPSQGCGYFILALGKLGGQELNYSSDIDLMAFFDGSIVPYCGEKTSQDCVVKMTQSLIGLIEERTEDGYVFRTDFRLRPDPSSTPVALSTQAAERYYESMGLNWERAALIKARPVAGDRVAAEQFLEKLRPFIWRRHLDFAAIDDIHSIKKRIHTYQGQNPLTVRGQNLKTGQGGIREIEFLAQIQQLIWGGRKPALRPGATCAVYQALKEEHLIDDSVYTNMTTAYWRLRQIEHRLQMIDDQQTHSLPETPEEMENLAAFLGVQDAPTLEKELRRLMTQVTENYDATMGVQQETEEAPVIFSGPEAEDKPVIAYLANLNFARPELAARLITTWLSGKYNATRGERARRLLESLLPALLTTLSKSSDPDRALAGMDTFFSELPAGVQIFSLLRNSPQLLDSLAEIMGSAPRLAQRLSRRPMLLEAMLSKDFFSDPPPCSILETELAHMLQRAGDMEEYLDITRRWAKDRKFQLGVGILRNKSDAEESAPLFSDIAEILIQSLQNRVEAEFVARHGLIPGMGLSVVALGKLGGRELTVASDIDLVMIHSDGDKESVSNGPKPLQAAVYFTRLGQRLINAITAPTSEGELYEVDLRLRPSGTQGPLVCSLTAFADYQRNLAWTWEHMALTRARVITGPSPLTRAVTKTIRDILTQKRHPELLAAEILAMRQRIRKTRPGRPPWDIKDMPGGLIDVEFICQYLQLSHADEQPEILHHNTGVGYRQLAKAGILSQKTAEELARATRFWHRLQGVIRLCFKENAKQEDFSRHLKEILSQAGKSENFQSLEKKIDHMASLVQTHFETMITIPAGRWSGEISKHQEF